ncbi:MAG: HAD family hydrolase [Lachnospiraceae bacterium]|nr:HAD family hydrolase [Lachnospiraceae bacterium]
MNRPAPLQADAILLDIDGTLWDTAEISGRAYTDGIRRFDDVPQITVTADDIRREFGKPLPVIFEDLFPHLEMKIRSRLMTYCDQLNNRYLWELGRSLCYPDVSPTLDILRQHYRLFIVSNCAPDYVDVFTTTNGLRDRIENFACLGHPHDNKAANIAAVVEKYGLRKAVYVGDTETDRLSARKAGVPFIFCTYGFGRAQEWDLSIDSFSQLPDCLTRL